MEQQEQVEWDAVNKLLQHHGFKPVHFADPVENKNLSDLVLLDKRSAGEIRATLRTMLTDSERRQALIQELVKSNNQLKEEAQEHMSRAAQQSVRATELEGLLDGVKTRVQDLEDRYLRKAVQQRSRTQQLEQEKQEAQKRCEVLEQKLSRQKEKAAELQRKLYFTIKEEERQSARQSQVFEHICQRVSGHNSAADEQVLDVIDFYESKMSRLLDELRFVKGGSDLYQMKSAPSSVTPSFKTILKEQQRESQTQIEELMREAERQTRLTELKLYKQSNTRLLRGDNSDVAILCDHYHHLLTELSAVVSPLFKLQSLKPSCDSLVLSEFSDLLPTLQVWVREFHLLKDLQQSLTKLAARLVPDSGHDSKEVKVENMMLLVDTMLESTSADEKVLRSPTRYTLESIVLHFQKMFDVNSMSGVYPCMNKVYSSLGEMTNAMRGLRVILDLDSKVSPAEVVNQVSRLVVSNQHTAGIRTVLGDADVDSIIIKMKQHEEFFPAFHAVMMDILQILGVSDLDDVLPTLKTFKQIAK